MTRYLSEVRKKVQKLRSIGETYGEIRKALGIDIPKSTLSYWCRSISLPEEYYQRVVQLNQVHLSKARRVAVAVNTIKREVFLNEIQDRNMPIAKKIYTKEIAKIALSMLCLGEASKYKANKSRSFSLGNSDPRIITIFLKLLEYCFDFNQEKIRCTVQCRADQDTEELKKYWISVTGIPEKLFYKPLIDPRTKGKPTKKPNYKGVLKVDYFDTKVQLDLESLANLIYNQTCSLNETRM